VADPFRYASSATSMILLREWFSPLWLRNGYAMDLHRDLLGPTCETVPEVPNPAPAERVRIAHQPRSTGFELARVQEALQRRFLAYTVSLVRRDPSGSTSPTRRRRGCSHPPRRLRIRLPPVAPSCHDRPAVESSHFHSNNSAWWRTTVLPTDPVLGAWSPRCL